MKDTHRRSIVKALTWRFIALVVTALVAWFIAGSLRFAGAIAGIDTVIKLAAYYFHERMWNRLSFGRVKEPDYEI